MVKFINEHFESQLIVKDFIPHHIIPSEFITSRYEIVGPLTLSVDNDTLMHGIKLAVLFCNESFEFYKDRYAFTTPMLAIVPDREFLVKIGMIQKDIYEKWKKSKDEKENNN